MCSDAAWGGHGRIWVCLGKVHDQGPLHQLDCFAQSGITVTMLRWSAAIVQAQKYNDLKGGEVLAALGHDFPKLEIKRPHIPTPALMMWRPATWLRYSSAQRGYPCPLARFQSALWEPASTPP